MRERAQDDLYFIREIWKNGKMVLVFISCEKKYFFENKREFFPLKII